MIAVFICVSAAVHTDKVPHTILCTHTHTHVKVIISSPGLCSKSKTSRHLLLLKLEFEALTVVHYICQPKFSIDNTEMCAKSCFKKHDWCLNDMGIYNFL